MSAPVLAQQQENAKVHPITFASRFFNAQERNYGVTKIETFAAVCTAKLFRPHLLGHHCEVIVLSEEHFAQVSQVGHVHS